MKIKDKDEEIYEAVFDRLINFDKYYPKEELEEFKKGLERMGKE